MAIKPKQKLPRLQPCVNKRAQTIIATHLNMGCLAGASVDTVSTGFSLDSGGPILAQLDSTAPKTARTHDISHICDKGHILIPKPPGTLIEARDHIYEASFLPRGASSVYSDADGMWHTKVFPSETPSSRTDAVMLDTWITTALARHQDEAANREAKGDLAHSVESLVPILSVALHEVVRQVTHHCAERGITLEKIWRVYEELFQRVLKQMHQSVALQKTRTTIVQSELAEAKEELRSVRAQHPQDMHRVITELEATFTHNQGKFEADLEAADEDNNRLREDIINLDAEIGTWYPFFGRYKDSYIKNHLPDLHTDKVSKRRSVMEDAFRSRRCTGSRTAEAFQVEEVPPEIAIAKDFKRLLAVLAPDKRKLIGQELSNVMDASVGGKSDNGARKENSVQHAEQDPEEVATIRELRAEVNAQEARIRALRNEIAKIETIQAHDQTEQSLAAGKEAIRPMAAVDDDVGDVVPSTNDVSEKAVFRSSRQGMAPAESLKDRLKRALREEKESEAMRESRKTQYESQHEDEGSSDEA